MQINFPVSLMNSNDITRNNLKNIDVLIMPDGNYRFLTDKNVNDALKDWVSTGGRLIAIENAIAQLSRNDWGFKIKGSDDKKDDKKDEAKEDYSALRRYENRERDFIPTFNPGSIFKIELDNSHPLAFGYTDAYYSLKQDDIVYDFIKQGGWNVGIIRKNNFVTGFTGSKAKEKLKDGLIFGVTDMGRGNVVMLADNPMFRSFPGKRQIVICKCGVYGGTIKLRAVSCQQSAINSNNSWFTIQILQVIDINFSLDG